MKRAGIAELKSRFSEYLRAVRRGDSVTVMDRETPIARLIPVEDPGITIEKPLPGSPPPSRIPLPPPLRLNFDVLEVLWEERKDR
jgi:prevent-host-death family protein